MNKGNPNKEKIIKLFEDCFRVKFTSCTSSNIEAYAKMTEGSSTDILIIFKNCTCYRYIGAGILYKELDQADSKGRWVNANLVKSNFDIKKYEYKT